MDAAAPPPRRRDGSPAIADDPPAALDLRGLRCPLPVLKTRKALSRLEDGATLAVLADDPLAGVDIPNHLRETGDVLIAQERLQTAWRFVIRRAAKGA